ncbi:hypothetical protein GQ457_04G032670 [Hibiscus cannabinus]
MSSTADSWISQSDLSSRSITAVRELMAGNRATILVRQLILDQDWHLNHHGKAHPGSNIQQHPLFPEPPQASSSESGMLSVRGKSKEEYKECSEL